MSLSKIILMLKILKCDDTFDLISSCIEQVYSEEESWTSSRLH